MIDDPDGDFDLKFLFANAFTRAVPSDACPAGEQLLRALTDEVRLVERTQVVDHLSTCPVCAELWRLASLGEGQ